jgi:hypothetical protein
MVLVMDLRYQVPRSPKKTLLGYMHLPRMMDKCRAVHQETLGEYIYPCPLDQGLLDFLGVTSEGFLEGVKGKSDEESERWIRQMATPHTPGEIQDWNQRFLQKRPETEEQRRFFSTVRDGLDPTRTDITTWVDLLDLEEGRDVPKPSS